MPSIENITNLAQDYIPQEDIALLQKAYDYAVKVYDGKVRNSGRPYITHPLAVTHILASMQLDLGTLVAGLLHGVMRNSEKPEAIEKEVADLFGKDIAGIVKGATRITNVQFKSKVAYQAENVRKMFLAMATDIRVLLVKLADRLHDMQTLEFTKERQLEIAEETMDLYAPLASRLGIDWIKRELEDLSFSYLYPKEHADLSGKIENSLSDRTAYVEEVKQLLSQKLKEHNIVDFRILGRPKHLYSIYKKLIAQNIPLEKVYDKVAFRIIVKTVKECYEALGVVHSIWMPIASRFKDFISSPKANMYQSLHTSVVGPYGEFMEVQIRTEDMDKIAQEGIAAHWAYKEGAAVSRRDAKLFQWLKQLIHGLGELEDPREFLSAVKHELHYYETYVLTPNGDVKELPNGSTPIDFAYSIHTQVGDRCIGAKVNGRIVPLKYQLRNGDVVEILTSANQNPKRGWLSLVKTSRARSRIRQWLKQEEHEKNLRVGRELCERELKKYNFSLKKIVKEAQFKDVLKSLSCNSLDDLLARIGRGKTTVHSFVKELLPEKAGKEKSVSAVDEVEEFEQAEARKVDKRAGRAQSIQVDGVDGVLTNISQCCMPVPGDEIVGFITAGRGISVHKASCRNLLATDPQRRTEVNWAPSVNVTHRAQIYVMAQDKKGLLATLSNTIAFDDANILSVEARTNPANLATFKVVVEVSSLDHLEKLLQHIRQLDGVLEANRK